MPSKHPFDVGDHPVAQLFDQYRHMGLASIAAPFKGVTTDGQVVPNLFRIASTGVSTRPVQDAADALLASLDADQRRTATFAVDDDAWRAWSNIHPFVMRHGVERALDLLRQHLLRDHAPVQRGPAT
jgi:hypothetical protein